jgi:polyketide cyclase/dehydrase/lipid transport protein
VSSGVVVAVSTVTAAPRSAVWAELERIEDHVRWMADATAIRFTGSRTRGVGTTFECDTRVGPWRMTDDMEITGWEPGSSMGVVHHGVVTGRGRFTLEDGPGPATTIRWEEELHFPPKWGGGIGARVARPVLAALWRGNLRRLRSRIESSAGS